MLSNSSRNSLKSESASICGSGYSPRLSRRLEVVSKQATKVTAISTKLEWRIDQFDKLMKLFKNGHNLISKQFSCPQAPSVVWELHVYPNGKRDDDNSNVSFFLRQVGLQRGEDPIMTEFQIYTLDANNSRISVCRDTKDFSNQQGRGKFQVQRDKMLTALRSDGSLMLICEVEYLPPGSKISVEQEDECEISEEFASRNDLLIRDALREMFENELFADCTIQCCQKSFMAHRCILGQHSLVFRSMFTQKTMLEAQNGTIHITDSRPEAVRAMLEFIYTGAVSPSIMDHSAQGILAIADKYAVFPLKDHCERYLASTITKKNVASMAIIADMYFANFLKKACTRFISTHHKLIIRSPEWKELKKARSELANELLESVLNEHGSNADASGNDSAADVDDTMDSCVILSTNHNSSGLTSSSSFLYDSSSSLLSQSPMAGSYSTTGNSSLSSLIGRNGGAGNGSLYINGSPNTLHNSTSYNRSSHVHINSNSMRLSSSSSIMNGGVDTTADEHTPPIRKRLRRTGVSVAAASSSNSNMTAPVIDNVPSGVSSHVLNVSFQPAASQSAQSNHQLNNNKSSSNNDAGSTSGNAIGSNNAAGGSSSMAM